MLTLCAGAVTAWLMNTHVPANWRALHDGLRADPRIAGFQVVGHEKGRFGWPIDEDYRIDGASFHLKGRPEAIVELVGPDPDVFTAPSHVSLGRIGPYAFWEESLGPTTGSTGPVDVGPNAEGPTPPFRVASLDDVISRYDDLIAFFASQPSGQKYRDRDGREWTRHIVRVDGGRRGRGRAPASRPATTSAARPQGTPAPMRPSRSPPLASLFPVASPFDRRAASRHPRSPPPPMRRPG